MPDVFEEPVNKQNVSDYRIVMQVISKVHCFGSELGHVFDLIESDLIDQVGPIRSFAIYEFPDEWWIVGVRCQ